MRKPDFCICENKGADQLSVTAKLISAFVLATQIVQSLLYLNPKFQVSGYFLKLCSLVCVGPGRKPRRKVFSERGSFDSWITISILGTRHAGDPVKTSLCELYPTVRDS